VDYAQGYGVSKPISLEDSGKVTSLAEMRQRRQSA
jgi:hypothetical protein